MSTDEDMVLELLECLEVQDGAGRLQQLALLQAHVDGKGLQEDLLQPVLDSLSQLLKDSNHKVCQKAIQVLHMVVQKHGTALASYSSWFLPVLVERLGDAKQQLVLQPAAKLLDDPNSGVREAAMVCIEELHQQLGSTVLERLEALHAKPAQLKQLQERFNHLAASSEAVQDFPLFKAVTVETGARQPGSVTSRSDCSSQSAGAESSVAARNAYSPLKVATSRSQASTPALLERASSSTDLKKGLIAALPKASVRRGGFKDSGGLTAAGELPEAPPIWVDSARELKAEIEKLVLALDEKQEWTKRIEALLQLESLVRGGAAGLEGFLEMLKPLRQPLTVQLNDRRSAVSKQACRILGLLSAALGAGFDMYALYFLPIIFKITVITVQVMAEAADLCCHTLVHHCPSPRLLKPIADAVCTDKNAKLRQCCAKYMLQVLEDWDMETCIKGLDLVEATIRSAAQDSSSETRSIGRSMYAAYVRAIPDKGQAFLRRMDTALQEKLSQAIQTYIPGQYQPLIADQQPNLSKVALPAACTLPLPPSPTPPSRPPSGRSTQSRAGAVSEEASFSQTPGHTAPAKKSSRKSVGGNALRVLSGATQNAAFDSAEAVRAPQSAKRVALHEQLAVPVIEAAQQLQHGQSHQPQHAHTDATYYGGMERLPGVANDSSAPAETSGQSHLNDGAGLTAGSVLTMASSAGSDWKAKLDMFVAMQHLLQQATGPAWPDFAGWSEKLVQIMLEHVGDPHFKVAHAALDAVQACLQHHASMLEASLDRLLPLLAHRIIDPKEAIRNAAVGCLECALELYPVELCLPQLARSLDTVKAAKGRTALLEVFTGNCGQAVTTAAALPALRVWVGRVATLVGDRNAEVRRAACQALHLVYTRMDGPTLLTHVAHASPPDQMTLRRALTPMLPNLDAQLVPYSRTRAGQPAYRPHTAPSASSMPSVPVSPSEEERTPAAGSSTALVQDQSDREPARFISPPLISEFSLSNDITGTKLHKNSANVHTSQNRISGRSSLSPGTAHNTALPITPTDITAHGRAMSTSPNHHGKALPLALQLQIATATHAVLQGCLPQVVSALLPLLTDSSWQAKQAAIVGIRGLASQGTALRLWLPALVPALLEIACHARPEVCMAADDCLASLLPQQPAAVCLTLLKANLPAQGTVNTPACQPTALIQASVKSIGRVVQRMPSAELLPELQSPDLLPSLFEAFDHHSADVRKAVTMCLMYMWQVMGDDLKPFLTGVSWWTYGLCTFVMTQIYQWA
ncbi:hypothetical protein WJX79_002530 [Trebouxia sp. C0005]